jgi:hypothetical protein
MRQKVESGLKYSRVSGGSRGTSPNKSYKKNNRSAYNE